MHQHSLLHTSFNVLARLILASTPTHPPKKGQMTWHCYQKLVFSAIKIRGEVSKMGVSCTPFPSQEEFALVFENLCAESRITCKQLLETITVSSMFENQRTASKMPIECSIKRAKIMRDTEVGWPKITLRNKETTGAH